MYNDLDFKNFLGGETPDPLTCLRFCSITTCLTLGFAYATNLRINDMIPHQQIMDLMLRGIVYLFFFFYNLFSCFLCSGGATSELYRNRKGYFSINVQAVVNSRLVFQNVVAKWFESAHDATIFANSLLCAKFECGEIGDAILLGDAG